MSTIAQPTTAPPIERRSAVARVIVRYPVAAFLVGAYGLGWPLLTVRAVRLPAHVHEHGH
jgi:hypothetical protein